MNYKLYKSRQVLKRQNDLSISFDVDNFETLIVSEVDILNIGNITSDTDMLQLKQNILNGVIITSSPYNISVLSNVYKLYEFNLYKSDLIFNDDEVSFCNKTVSKIYDKSGEYIGIGELLTSEDFDVIYALYPDEVYLYNNKQWRIEKNKYSVIFIEGYDRLSVDTKLYNIISYFTIYDGESLLNNENISYRNDSLIYNKILYNKLRSGKWNVIKNNNESIYRSISHEDTTDVYLVIGIMSDSTFKNINVTF